MSSPGQNATPGGTGGGFLLNVNLVFLSTVAAYGLGFLVVVLVARELGPEGRGVTALYQAAVSLGFAFFSLGIGTAVVFLVGRREMSGPQALEAGLSVTLLALGLTGAGVLIAAILFNDELGKENVPFWLLLVAVPAVIQVSNPGGSAAGSGPLWRDEFAGSIAAALGSGGPRSG